MADGPAKPLEASTRRELGQKASTLPDRLRPLARISGFAQSLGGLGGSLGNARFALVKLQPPSATTQQPTWAPFAVRALGD